MNPEEHAKLYQEAKLAFLLPADIEQFRRLNELVNSFPRTKTYNDLVDVESELAVLSFGLQATVARLSSQYDHARRHLDSRIKVRGLEILDEMRAEEPENKRGFKGIAEDRAGDEFLEERQRLSIYESIANEYRNKLFATKEVFMSIAHKLKQLNKDQPENT